MLLVSTVLCDVVVVVDGNWSEWKDWGDCPVTCDGGVQNRSRTCTNPPPSFGGESCPGESDESRACNEDPCPSKMFAFIIFLHGLKIPQLGELEMAIAMAGDEDKLARCLNFM